MIRRALLVGALVGGTWSAGSGRCAESLPAATNVVSGVTLQVTRVKSGRASERKPQSGERDTARAVSIRVDVYNGSGEERRFTVEVYFVARLAGGTREVFDHRELHPLIGARAHYAETVTSRACPEREVRDWRGWGTETSAGRIEGYIVRLLCEDVLLKVAASSHPLEQLGRDFEKLWTLVPSTGPESAQQKRNE